MKKIKVFVDSDVIISSLISTTGAAHLLLNKTENIELLASNYSLKELDIVVKRLRLNKKTLNKLIKQKFHIIEIIKSLEEIKKHYHKFTNDINDTHIIAGAEKGKAKFLISYNTKHFYEEKIMRYFDINLITPARLIQYLRSLS